MDPFMITIGLIIIILSVLYYYGQSSYGFWRDLGIPYITPEYPYLGTNYKRDFGWKVNHYDQKEKYELFEGEPFFGTFSFRRPILFLRDPKLVEAVLIKDFSSFYNRAFTNDPKEVMSAHLINLKDAAWKSLRNKLTPVFSSGKLKGMFDQLVECSDELINYLSKHENGTSFEAKEIMSRYSINVISSCAFGLSADGLSENSTLAKIGMSIFANQKSTAWQIFRSAYPRLGRWFNPRTTVAEVRGIFQKTLDDTLEYRKKNDIHRPDFLHLLNELKTRDLKDAIENPNVERPLLFDDNVFLANAFVFFVAGFETTATTLSFALYELAVNQDVQEKLYQELKKKLSNEKISVDDFNNVPYLKQVISETLRKHPPASGVSRVANKPFVIPNTKIEIPANTIVHTPIYSFHHDPKYFPEPEKFDPDRFSDENKHKISKNTYMPFGDGPRICIGARFARLEAEVALAKIILSYKVTLSSKTITPLTYKKVAILLSAEGGIWLNITKRD